MTLDELNKIIRDTVKVLTSLSEVIRYYPNAPRPATNYATVNIAQLTKIGNIDKKEETNIDDLDEIIIMQYEAMVSVNFYRKDARYYAALTGSSLNRYSVLSDWNGNRMGLINVSSVRDLSLLLDADYEERAQIDIFVHFELTAIPELVTGIDTANVKGVIDNGSEVLENIDITVP